MLQLLCHIARAMLGSTITSRAVLHIVVVFGSICSGQVAICEMTGLQTVVAGNSYTCTLTTAGAAKCWGQNNYGQLGDGTTTDRQTAVNVSGLTAGVSLISAGGFQTCAVTTSGAAKCWGRNNYGQLGDGTTTDNNTAVDVLGLTTGVNLISVGGFHTCAVTTSGAAKC